MLKKEKSDDIIKLENYLTLGGIQMKKGVILTMLLVLATVFSSCGADKHKIIIKEDTIRIKIDEKYTVKAETKKKDNITWSSHDEKIAIVGPDGTVTAVGGGITTITARTEKSYAHVGVIVEGASSYIDKNGNENLVFNGESDIEEIIVGVKGGGKGEVSIRTGDKFTLKAYTTPSDSKDKIVWQSQDKNVVRVNSKGEMEAVGPGKTSIFAYAPNGVKGELIVRVK